VETQRTGSFLQLSRIGVAAGCGHFCQAAISEPRRRIEWPPTTGFARLHWMQCQCRSGPDTIPVPARRFGTSDDTVPRSTLQGTPGRQQWVQFQEDLTPIVPQARNAKRRVVTDELICQLAQSTMPEGGLIFLQSDVKGTLAGKKYWYWNGVLIVDVFVFPFSRGARLHAVQV
jgi:hypothetical protein